MLGILGLWMGILVCVGWLEIANGHEKQIVGIIVNINLLFFYGAPLQTIKTVLREKSSESIHAPTMFLNCVNAGFWGAYGIAINNIIIYGPNGLGFFLGLIQAFLCAVYPKQNSEVTYSDTVDPTPLLNSSEGSPETEVEERDPATGEML